ncbi:unnamed protein product, partial [Effrenium voratum]
MPSLLVLGTPEIGVQLCRARGSSAAAFDVTFSFPKTAKGLKTAFLFGGSPKPPDPPTMQVAGQDPESKLRGQVHYQDQEGCYAGCASDSMAGGKSYGSVTPKRTFPKPDEEEVVPPPPQPAAQPKPGTPGAPGPGPAPAKPAAKPAPKAQKPRLQKVCDPWGRITGAYKGKLCQGSDSCVTALPLDFGQRTGAPFCPQGDCSGKAGHPWCVPAKFLKRYDGPIEINCKSSGEGTLEQGDPSGCWWFEKNVPREELQRLPGVVIGKYAPRKGMRFYKRTGKGLTFDEAERWVQTGQLVDPASVGPDPDDPNDPSAKNVEDAVAERARANEERLSRPPGSRRPAPRALPAPPMAEAPADNGLQNGPLNAPVPLNAPAGKGMGKGEEKPPVHGIPHPKKRQGNKPGKNKQESYDNREEGGSGRVGDEDEESMPFLAGLLGAPPI